MAGKEAKTDKSLLADKENALLQMLNAESDSIKESFGIIDDISRKYGINITDVRELLQNKDKYISVPVGLFRTKLGPLEAVVRYLKDVLDYSLVKSAKLLSRDETTIWTSYNNSIKKSSKIIVDLEMKDIDFKDMGVKKGELIIPLSTFSERKLSVLESLCIYLRETFRLSYHDIGLLLGRNERTIWTAVNRAGKKLKNG